MLKSGLMLSITTFALLVACGASTDTGKASAQNAKAQEIKTHVHNTAPETAELSLVEIGDGFHMITGPGGNIGVLSGPDGLLVIDDKFERHGAEIIAKLSTISTSPIRLVLNTHYHGDHTGSNDTMKTSGAIIVAHDNVRKRMGMTFENKLFGRRVEATDSTKWPNLTYSENATFYMNGQTARAIHVSRAHTDGDTIIHFEEGNVIHMGDNYFNGLFPYVDIDAGGTLQGMIAAQSAAIDLATDTTKIIPGHGPMATRADLIATRDMLQDILVRVKEGIDKGQSLDAIIEAKVLNDFNAFASFINEDNMIRIAHRSITGG